MSPKTKSSLVNLTAFIGAVVAVAGLTGGAKRMADTTYVRADTFAIHRQHEQDTRALDSVVHRYELDRLNGVVANVDTIKQCLRHPRQVMCQ